MKRNDAENLVRSWGFSHVFTWTDGPNAHYPPHSHNTLTTHLILSGELEICYPGDQDPPHHDDTGCVEVHSTCRGVEKARRIWRYGEGGRIDVDAGRIHEVWVGPKGCTYVIGEK
ncbi:hypothetical protein EV426DRAFT_593098 [Tirmania nivea]|nr:hypothetical protein EV426DRAFT_593098 [Tirmania nivea]